VGEISKLTTTGKSLYHGVTQVGTTPIRLCPNLETHQGIVVRAPGQADVDAADQPIGNTGLVYLGDHRVTADHSNTGGFPLLPGMAIVIPINDPSELYVVATKQNQIVQWMGL
jgi:hypothetical protein